jgi:CheY-like chemotaxis protein
MVAAMVVAKSDARVLVVEDRSDVRASIVRILTHDGFQVSEAADGERALSLLAQRNDFALLCIDGVMPGLSTSTVIEQAEKLAPAMRILLCSGYLEEDLLRRGVATGRLKLLQKPFTSEELLKSVHELLSGVA